MISAASQLIRLVDVSTSQISTSQSIITSQSISTNQSIVQVKLVDARQFIKVSQNYILPYDSESLGGVTTQPFRIVRILKMCNQDIVHVCINSGIMCNNVFLNISFQGRFNNLRVLPYIFLGIKFISSKHFKQQLSLYQPDFRVLHPVSVCSELKI